MVTIDGYVLDVAVSEEHAFDSEVTSHPVEQGADISDHVLARPINVSIEGVVSDTPIGAAATARGDTTLPSSDAFARLIAIRNAREPVIIETSLQVFRNMVLQSLQVPRSSSTGDALRFRATFVQVQLVVNERTVVEVAVPVAAKKKNLGNKAAPAVDAADVAPKTQELRSVLKSGVRWEKPQQFFGVTF
jgi:hypothetical protein